MSSEESKPTKIGISELAIVIDTLEMIEEEFENTRDGCAVEKAK